MHSMSRISNIVISPINIEIMSQTLGYKIEVDLASRTCPSGIKDTNPRGSNRIHSMA